MLHGADLSTFQRGVDYVALGAAIDFGYCKTSDSEGSAYFEDSMHKTHHLGLSQQGKRVGDYAFGHPSQDAIASADFFVEHAWFDDLRPVIDMESLSKGKTPFNAGPWCLMWLERVFLKTGVRPIIYAGPYYDADMRAQCPAIASYDLWRAAYPGMTGWPVHMPQDPRCVAWQWTGTGRVAGIRGNADLDIAPSFDRLAVSPT